MPVHKFAILKDDVVAVTKHYIGLPPMSTCTEESEQLLQKAKLLVMYDTWDNGYELYRYDKNGNFAGDTWHATEDDLIEQVKYEFNLKGIHWRDVPKGVTNPVDYAIEYMKTSKK